MPAGPKGYKICKSLSRPVNPLYFGVKESHMKKLILGVMSLTLLSVACKNKKAAVTTNTNPTATQLQAVQERIPATTMADLDRGHAIFYGQCTNCHGAKNVSGYPEDALRSIMSDMSKKAKLADTEKEAVWKYALAVNLASKKGS
jgi:mono/diheme cytochrome c family protein